jgi:hypothetical protein
VAQLREGWPVGAPDGKSYLINEKGDDLVEARRPSKERMNLMEDATCRIMAHFKAAEMKKNKETDE